MLLCATRQVAYAQRRPSKEQDVHIMYSRSITKQLVVDDGGFYLIFGTTFTHSRVLYEIMVSQLETVLDFVRRPTANLFCMVAQCVASERDTK